MKKMSLFTFITLTSFVLLGILGGCSSSSSSKEDADSDGYCTRSDACKNTALLTGDCNDNDATINPGITETTDDGIDNDCDGETDEEESSGSVNVNEEEDQSTDDDGDGYTEEQDDCDDANAAINPGATETNGDGVDNNCDGIDGTTTDADGDGISSSEDCNDHDATVGIASTYYLDSDADGYGTDSEVEGSSTTSCETSLSGYATTNTDCDDANASVNPGANEGFFYGNGDRVSSSSATLLRDRFEFIRVAYAADEPGHGDDIDNDCDGTVDEGVCDCESIGMEHDHGNYTTTSSLLNRFDFIRSAHAATGGESEDANYDADCAAQVDTFKSLGYFDCVTSSSGSTSTTPTSSSDSIDNGYMFWLGQKLDYDGEVNYEYKELTAKIGNQSNSASGNSRNIQATAYAKFNKSGGSTSYDWETWVAAVAFDSDTLKVQSKSKSLSCNSDSDGYCQDSVEYSITSDLTNFSGWSMADIKSGNYAFFVALNGLVLEPNTSQQLEDLYAKVWIENDTTHSKDFDNDTGTGSNGIDHYSADGNLKVKVAIDSNGDSTTYDWSGTVYFTIVGVDITKWGSKWWEYSEGTYSSSGDYTSMNKTLSSTLDGTTQYPDSSSRILPILYSWGWNHSTGFEVDELHARAKVYNYTTSSHQANIRVYGSGEKKNRNDYLKPNATQGYLLWCTSDDICSVDYADTGTESDSGGSDTASISTTVP